MVCPANSYSFRATALIFCRMFIHIMDIDPSGYRYMVCPAISSYSFGGTALIFCMMFIHIMEVCMSTWFWWSGGGIMICVLQTHFIFFFFFFFKSLLTKQLSIIIKCGVYFFSSFSVKLISFMYSLYYFLRSYTCSMILLCHMFSRITFFLHHHHTQQLLLLHNLLPHLMEFNQTWSHSFS